MLVKSSSSPVSYSNIYNGPFHQAVSKHLSLIFFSGNLSEFTRYELLWWSFHYNLLQHLFTSKVSIKSILKSKSLEGYFDSK